MGVLAAVAAVSVGVVPAGAQEGSQPYADVASDAYYAQAVEALESRGVFEGTECAEGFCPHQPLPRWQMAIWLVRALEEAEPQATVSRFADVESQLWWMPYAERLAELEITVGCKSEPLRYCPDRFVSRSQMAAFLTRAFKLPDAESPAGFADVSEESWAFNYINALAASKITVGCRSEPLRYCPERSVTRAQMAAFIYRGLKWKEAQAEVDKQTQEQPEFITEENDLSRWIKHDLIDEYGDKWPWLKEVWDYANREDFEYIAGYQNSFGYRTLRSDKTGDIFAKIESYTLMIREETVGSPYYLNSLAHELAHVYTHGHGAATNPAPIAIGWLYFESIEQDCSSSELYAETAEYIDPDFEAGSFYWRRCSHLPRTPTAEAITVVSQAFSGQMPDWFYETFQKSDGSLDYVKLWMAVKDSSYGNRERVVPMLRDAFGGYCSDQIVWDTTFSFGRFGLPPLVQPWRDGGCGLGASVADSPEGTYEAVTAGDSHACALSTDGTIACWGGNDHGQSDAPDGTYEAVAAGGDHTCALRTDGAVACWGGNDYGQSDAPDGTYEAVTASSGYSCALHNDGRIACWGRSGRIEAPSGTYGTVTAGRGNNCALSSDDAIVCWGRKAYDGPDGSYEDISTGWDYSCAVRNDGAVVCWGRRRGADGRRTYPPAGTYEAVSVGWDHTCALRRDSTVVCWGGNGFGQSDVPAGAYEAVASGLGYTCALRTDGTVACWGGDLGRTDPPDP